MQINKMVLQEYLELLQKCSSTSLNEDVSDKVMFHERGLANASRGRMLTFIHEDIDFEGLFQIETILKIVKAVTGEEINLDFDGDELKISSAKTKLGLKPLLFENWQSRFIETPLNFFEDKKFKKLPTNFIQALTAVKHCAADEKKLSVLSSVAIIGDNCISSDNYKIGHHKLEVGFKSDFLIDIYNIDGLIMFNPTHYYLDSDRILFKSGLNMQMCAINPVKKYPNFLPVLNREKSSTLIELPEEMKEAVNIAQQIPGKTDDSLIKLEISKNKLALSYNTISGWFKRNIRLVYAGKPISFSININVLNDALKNIGNGLMISEEGTGMMILDGFRYVFPVEI